MSAERPTSTHVVPQVADVYVQVIIDEAASRGIEVEVLDADRGDLRLGHGGRAVLTRASLSELTSAIAMDRCRDKLATRAVLGAAGIPLPRGRRSDGGAGDAAFLDEVGEVVVKPADGECGDGITVGVTTPEELHAAREKARGQGPDVVLEERIDGVDLRIVVIAGEVVAAAVRLPAAVVGDGETDVAGLVEEAEHLGAGEALGGEALDRPGDDGLGGDGLDGAALDGAALDGAALDTVARAGFDADDVPAPGERVPLRATANVHTGGTIEDATADLHPDLAALAVAVAEAIGIPVVGVDLLVADVDDPRGAVVIEANERPGLANHGPQPTVQRFVDLLFPATVATSHDAAS